MLYEADLCLANPEVAHGSLNCTEELEIGASKGTAATE
jgi:hypothetical protein